MNPRIKYILRAKNIIKSFGSLKAVDDVSLSIERGDIFGLVGESGCGKSTLARIIMRLIDADKASVIFDDNDISHLNENKLREIRKKMQIIFQDPVASLNPKMTVGEAIEEPFVVHGNGRGERPLARTKKLLNDVGLGEQYVNRYPHEISGGECQRVCIARAMALDPLFVVLDEPVSSLDYSVQGKIIDLLLSIKKAKGLTYLFITHDLVLAQKICNKVAVMKDGRIIESGYSKEIFASPKEEYTKQLMRDSI